MRSYESCRVLPYALCAAAPVLLAASIPAHAGSCSDPATARACAQQRLDGLLLVDPPGDRAERRLEGKPWASSDADNAPVAVTTSQSVSADTAAPAVGETAAGKMTMQTSIAQWSTFSQQATYARLQAAQSTAVTTYKPPLPSRPDPAFDAWAAYDSADAGQGASGAPGTLTPGSPAREQASRAGADYKLGRVAVVGVAVATQEKDDGAEQITASYFAFRPAPALTLDGRLGRVDNHPGAVTGAPEASQRFLTARLRSDLPVGAFKLSPAVSFAHGDEALKDAAPSAREVNKLAIAPRLSSPVDLGDGRRVEPFVSLDRQLTLDQPVDGQPPSRPTTSYGAGVRVERPNAYSLDMSSSIEDAGRDKQPTLKGRLELKVPLR